MIELNDYMPQLISLLKAQFKERLVYVGLQGSYLRGEASENSDIDIMVVIDQITIQDLHHYRTIIQSMEYYEKSCGFICSKFDLASWNPLEICHLLNTTKDYFGVLHELVPAYTDRDLRNFIKLSINNLYHEICHRYIHAELSTNEVKLIGSYKCVFFILQNLFFLKTGQFVSTKSELLPLLTGKDYAVLEQSMTLSHGNAFDFPYSFNLLFTWCQETLASIS